MWLLARTLMLTAGTGLLLSSCGGSGIAGIDEASSDRDVPAQYASAPLIEKFHDDLTFTLISCAGFDVVRHLVADVTVKTFFNRAGEPVRVTVHVVERNTLTNSISGRAVSYPGILNVTFDLPNGTTRVTGTPIHITVPGEGNFIFDAGILITDQDGNILFQGGPHPFGPAPDETIFCSLLA